MPVRPGTTLVTDGCAAYNGIAWLFADTVGGANPSANLYLLIDTANANNIEPRRYLVALFKKLPLAQTVDA